MKKHILFYVIFLIIVSIISLFFIKIGNSLNNTFDKKINEFVCQVINGDVTNGEIYLKYNGSIVLKDLVVSRQSGDILNIPETVANISLIKSLLFRRIVIDNIRFIQPQLNLYKEDNNLNIANLFQVVHKDNDNSNDSLNPGFRTDINLTIHNIEIDNGKVKLRINSFYKIFSNVNIKLNLKISDDNLLIKLKNLYFTSDSLIFKSKQGLFEIDRTSMEIRDVNIVSDVIKAEFYGQYKIDKNIFTFTGNGEGLLDFINYFAIDSIPIDGSCSFDIKGTIEAGMYRIESNISSNIASYDIYDFTGITGEMLIKNDTLEYSNTTGFYKNSKLFTEGVYYFNDQIFRCSLKTDSLLLNDLYGRAENSFAKSEAIIIYSGKENKTYLKANLSTYDNTRFRAQLDIIGDSINIDTILIEKKEKLLYAKGKLLTNKKELNIDLLTKDFELNIINKLISDSLEGDISGKFTIKGIWENPDIYGKLSLYNFIYRNLKIKYLYMNTDLSSMMSNPKGDLHINGNGIKIGNNTIDIFNMDGKSIDDEFLIDFNSKSNLHKLNTLLSVKLESIDNIIISIDSFEGTIFGVDCYIPATTFVSYINRALIIKELNIYSSIGGNIIVDLYFHDNKINSNILLNKFNLLALNNIIKSYPLGGNIDAKFTLQGKLSNPNIFMVIDSDSLFIKRNLLKGFKLSVNMLDELLDVKNLSFYSNDNYSKLSGKVNFRRKVPSINIVFSLNNLPLELIPNIDFVKIYSGVSSINGSLTGDIKNPYFDFDGSIDNLSFYIPDYGIKIDKMLLNILGKDSRIMLNNILASTENNGYIKCNGDISYKDSKFKSYRMNAEFSDISVRYFDIYNGLITGTTYLNGDMNEFNINSDIDISNSDINISFRNPPVFSYSQNSDKNDHRLRTNYNISLHIDKNVWFRNEDMEIEVGGDINMRNFNKNIFVNGFINANRGYYYYFDRPFSIKEGLIKFNNTADFNPTISIKTETNVSHMVERNRRYERENILVHLDVSGYAKNPEISIYSEPQKSTIAILSLLNINLTPDELMKLDIIGANISEKIINYYLRTKLISNIQKRLGIDIFDIETSLLSQNKYARINIGKYLAKNFFVSYSHDIFSQGKDEFRLDYYFENGINIFGERDYTGRFNTGIGLIYRY
jgi:hypothetical protein